MNPAGELHARWHRIYPSLLNSYEKLKKLGFTYSDGKFYQIIKVTSLSFVISFLLCLYYFPSFLSSEYSFNDYFLISS